MNEHRRNGGIHSAGQRAKHSPLADLPANPFHEALGQAGYAVGTFTAADVLQKVAKQTFPLRRMRDLRMELYAVELALIIRKGCNGTVFRSGNFMKSFRQREHRIIMRHPYIVAVDTFE